MFHGKVRRGSGILLQAVDSEDEDTVDEDEDMPDAEDTSAVLHRTVSLTGSARLPPGVSNGF